MQEQFNLGALGGSFIEGAIVAGVSAIPGVGAIAVGAASAVGGGINNALTQYGDSGKIDWGQVMEDTIISGALGGIAYKVNTYSTQCGQGKNDDSAGNISKCENKRCEKSSGRRNRSSR